VAVIDEGKIERFPTHIRGLCRLDELYIKAKKMGCQLPLIICDSQALFGELKIFLTFGCEFIITKTRICFLCRRAAVSQLPEAITKGSIISTNYFIPVATKFSL
jgi:hypothetical protein